MRERERESRIGERKKYVFPREHHVGLVCVGECVCMPMKILKLKNHKRKLKKMKEIEPE